MTSDVHNDPYQWQQEGWRSWRPLMPGRGMYHDVRRRLPYYWSDIRDGFNYRTFTATIRIYFVNLLPALAFQLRHGSQHERLLRHQRSPPRFSPRCLRLLHILRPTLDSCWCHWFDISIQLYYLPHYSTPRCFSLPPADGSGLASGLVSSTGLRRSPTSATICERLPISPPRHSGYMLEQSTLSKVSKSCLSTSTMIVS